MIIADLTRNFAEWRPSLFHSPLFEGGSRATPSVVDDMSLAYDPPGAISWLLPERRKITFVAMLAPEANVKHLGRTQSI